MSYQARIESDGTSYAIEVKDFWAYVTGKGLTRDQIRKLAPGDREKLLLRWKHGLSDHHANQEIEQSKRYLLNRNELIETFPENQREYVKNYREFDAYCTRIKVEIGLIAQSRTPVKADDDEVQSFVDSIGGTLVDHGVPQKTKENV